MIENATWPPGWDQEDIDYHRSRVESPEQRERDMELIISYLRDGNEPWQENHGWGGLEWAIARVLRINLGDVI